MWALGSVITVFGMSVVLSYLSEGLNDQSVPWNNGAYIFQWWTGHLWALALVIYGVSVLVRVTIWSVPTARRR